ncbi:MAG TPA: hypothetical protein VFX61_04050 [Micromonosporaceae bacterium]|nr:hypothetical protein [Micromonosporaceae bacterium]
MSEQEYIDICALLGVEAWLQGWALWHTWDQQSRRITMVSTMVSATEGMLLTWSKGHHVMPVKPPRAAVAATVKGWLGPAIRSPGYAAETGVTEAVTASASPHLTGGSTAPGDRSQGLSRVEQTRQAAPGYRPRVSLTDADIASALASAGLQFVERVHGDVRDPLPPGKGAATCGDEDGRFDSSPDEIVDVHDPDFVAKVNAGWWRMASEYGLLDGQREFLLAVDYSEPEAIGFEIGWARVRLSMNGTSPAAA